MKIDKFQMNKAPKFETIEERKEYLQQHVINDLHWLVRAAYEWEIQLILNLQINGYHMQIFAMDSVFMRSRALFEFLTEDNSNRESRFYYTVLDIGLRKPLESELYEKWKNQIHSHTGIHLQSRSNNKKLQTASKCKKDLDKMPLELTKEIIRLWRELIDELEGYDSGLKEVAEKGLNNVLVQAEEVINSVIKNRRKYELNDEEKSKVSEMITKINNLFIQRE